MKTRLGSERTVATWLHIDRCAFAERLVGIGCSNQHAIVEMKVDAPLFHGGTTSTFTCYFKMISSSFPALCMAQSCSIRYFLRLRLYSDTAVRTSSVSAASRTSSKGNSFAVSFQG